MGINGFQLILLFLEINRLEMNRAMKEVILHLASFPSDKVLIERERQREGGREGGFNVCILHMLLMNTTEKGLASELLSRTHTQ